MWSVRGGGTHEPGAALIEPFLLTELRRLQTERLQGLAQRGQLSSAAVPSTWQASRPHLPGSAALQVLVTSAWPSMFDLRLDSGHQPSNRAAPAGLGHSGWGGGCALAGEDEDLERRSGRGPGQYGQAGHQGGREHVCTAGAR